MRRPDRRRERLAELLADHLPADWPVLHHQHGVEPQEFARAFDQIMALTKGGPDSKTETVSYLIFQNGLGNGEYSYQMANAVTFFIVLAIPGLRAAEVLQRQEKV